LRLFQKSKELLFMTLNKSLIYLLLLLSPVLANAQTPSDICYVRSHLRTEKQRGSNYVLGEFRPLSFDDLTTKSFTYLDTKLIITVSLEYEGRYSTEQKGKPKEIFLALSVSDKEIKNAFDAVDNVVARTSYGKRWGHLSVEKQGTQGNMIYTFVVSCNDGTKLNVKRK
jgi:hypothetical protein